MEDVYMLGQEMHIHREGLQLEMESLDDRYRIGWGIKVTNMKFREELE